MGKHKTKLTTRRPHSKARGETVLRRSVVVIIRLKNGLLLFQLRGGDHPTQPFTWTFFGGVMKPREGPVCAAVRELAEELNLKVRKSDLKELFVHRAPRTGYPHQLREVHYVLLKRKIGWPKTLREGAGCGFFHRSELEKLPGKSRRIMVAMDRKVI